MSAFLCSDCHLSALAVYAARNRLYVSSERDVLGILGRANVESIRSRYPSSEETYSADICSCAMLKVHTPIQIIKACHCYAYQACEAKSWNDSDAKKIIDAIESHAIRRLPGYETAAWEIMGAH
jgi:hypothetical protein